MSARHADDQELCRQRTGIVTGKLCDACEGRCPICDSRSNPSRPVKICDSCAGVERFAIFDQNTNNNGEDGGATANSSSLSSNNAVQTKNQYLGTYQSQARCIICTTGVGKHIAYYCRACTLLEKDRDGCPKVKFIGHTKQMSHLRVNARRNKDSQQQQSSTFQ